MDWPYEDTDGFPLESTGPVWECPDDTCLCDEVGPGGDEVEFAVRLLDPIGKAMPDALCRIRHRGRVINEHQPRADAGGWVAAFVPHVPTTVVVEWAPGHAPEDHGYPYRRRFFVDLGTARHEMSRRRLHNLGFVKRRSLRENVEEFQRHYGYENVTGNIEDIEEDLALFHDTGSPPSPDTTPATADGPPPDQSSSTSVQVLPDGVLTFAPPADGGRTALRLDDDPTPGGAGQPIVSKPVPPQVLADPPPPQKARTGAGCVKLTSVLPTVREAIVKKQALFELVRVVSTWTDPSDPSKTVTGMFWVFSDALMIELPDDAEWNWWKGTRVEQPFPVNPFGGRVIRNRKRLIRLPCKGSEAEDALGALTFSQNDLTSSPDSLALPLPRTTSDKKLPCLLQTAELYDITFDQADVRIPVQSVNPNKGCIAEVTAYAEKVADAIDAATKKSKVTTPRLLGTPGKIWAITDRMDTWVCCCFFSSWVFACINHGFHQQILGHKNGRPIIKMIQNRGGCHDLGHTDYSQIFQIVAGWCLAMDVGETRVKWRRTEDVYRSPTLCNLVRPLGSSGRATPAPDIHYRGNVKNIPRPTSVCKRGVPPCPPVP